ncbi:MAG: peptidase dimerization domain-containing protein, partial [Mycobacterium leprae]
NPHLGVNAADAAMLTFAGLNALRQHVRSDCRIHGIIKNGGDAPNIVPDYAEVEMLARAKDQAYLLQLVERLHNCARGGALAAGATVAIEQGLVFAEQLTLSSYREIAKANLAALGLPVPATVKQSFASADSGNVSYAMPHLTFGLPLDDKGSSPHTPAFVAAANSDTGRQALNTAAKIMATTVIDLLTDPAKLAAIKAEHQTVLAAATAGA